AYLHFDKPYYVAGDTIYFKAYVTLGEKHRLSSLSGVLHIELVNTNNKIDQSIKLQLTNGLTWGDFALPDSLPKGNYRVRAYTQWMRNAGDDVYFDQTIPVGSALHTKISESSTARISTGKAKPDVQFFPEGGEMLAGIPSKIAFKAIGVNGLGVNVKGIIIDNDNQEVSSFASTHLGMGYFYLTPLENKTYRAKLTYPDGQQSFIDLPQTAAKGITLKVNNDSLDKAVVQLIANESYFVENRGKTFNLLVYSAGLTNMVTIRLDSTVINLAILKRRLYTGITRITLFSGENEPLSERLIFIQNPDLFNLEIDTNKITRIKRGKVQIGVHAVARADSAVTGHFSISVIDESKMPVDENAEATIFSYLLLTSELKGNIEQPNYYFAHITDKTRACLDLVMLTHGYKRFEWKKLLNAEYPPIAYHPETGLEITGTAKSIFGKPLVNGTVSLISLRGGPFISVATGNKGSFRFSNLSFTDTTKFILQAVNAKGKNSTQLIYNKDQPGPPLITKSSAQPEDVNQLMPAYLENHKEQLIDYAKYGDPKGRVLKEVKIKAVKRDDDYASSNLGGPGHADVVIHAEQIENMGGFLSLRLQGKTRGLIHWVPARNGGLLPYSGRGGGVMSVFLDGVAVDIDQVNPNDIETVEVLAGANASIYGMVGGNGVIILTSKQGKGLQSKDIASTGILSITAHGYYKAREFYSPKYDESNLTGKHADLRTTIYWKPELVTDKGGNASFDYYNADGTGTYRVVIEGIDDKGNLGRQVYRYRVE
ncbi:MAG: TonB-dependent receptor, partial [Mucilaginibacter sp.]|nr:TonB-dependent receptor [Mucilaginibacter sp.]